MIGGIIGDIIGSTYEFRNTKQYDFEPFPAGSLFTDDTVLTVSVAEALLRKESYGECMRRYGLYYPGRGYGGMFQGWLSGKKCEPYNSFGNGSAMRVGPVGWAFDSFEVTMEEARKSAECTHNHPEGIKGAQAVAAAIYLSRFGSVKQEIRDIITENFGYDLSRTLDEIRPGYTFNETCQKTVPEAITCFLEGENFEDAIRKAIWLGGDSDTLACITGSIAEAYYREYKQNIPATWKSKALSMLPEEFKGIIREFEKAFQETSANSN
jgi:ADP-ribosylglycohydrolase